METLETITIKEYLDRKGITYKEQNGELITKCLFNNCDDDSRNGEAHLYFDTETGQYDCKKCGEKGNIITLAKHLGDDVKDIAVNSFRTPKKRGEKRLDPLLVEKYHQALPERIRQYLNARGITNAIISEHKLGWSEFYGKRWITIPIQDIDENFVFLKLRRDPEDKNNPDKFKFYPTGSSATIYGWEMLKNNKDMIMICEGEFDRLVLSEKGIPAITSTAGAGTFKKEWIEHLKSLKEIYVCCDKDKAGEKGAERIIKLLKENLKDTKIYKITLPDRMTDGKDITDYFVEYNGDPDELIYKLSKQVAGKKPINASKFKPILSQDLIKILGLTIKKDEENKLITFLCQLSAYTENSQFNISFNAPSSTGKSYIPTEIARLFPEKNVIEIGYCSPTAFFHDVGEYNKEQKGYTVDLSRKVLIFLDQPHTQLLERLRPMLSHDKKEINLKITDKTQKHGIKTKNVLLRGYPAVIFCTAGLKIDEQEATRFLLLSPETNQEKIRQAIHEKIKKETDANAYQEYLNNNPERKLLKERIQAIREENIKEIKISSPEKIEERFFEKKKMLKPRHSRDIGRFISLIKSFALLNLWFRKKEDSVIIANDDDIEEAFKVWNAISESQELNLPPYIYHLYHEIILSAWNDKNKNRSENLEEIIGDIGLTRQDIIQKHYQVYGRFVADWLLRQQIIPMLETAGLIMQEQDPNDKRKMLIYPTASFAILKKQNNSERGGGVKKI